MSSFLSAIGDVAALLCAALFIKWASTKVVTEYKKLISFGGNMFLFVSCYFILAILIPRKQLFGTPDFPAYYYFGSMISLSICSGVFLHFFQKVSILSENKLKSQINILISFIFRTRNHHYPKPASKALYAEIHNKTIAAEDTVADNANEFEEDLITTLEKIPQKTKKIERANKKI